MTAPLRTFTARLITAISRKKVFYASTKKKNNAGMYYIRPNNHVLYFLCFHGRHMPFIIESSNQCHTIPMALLPPGSTLYLYFPLNYSISDTKSTCT